MKCPNCFAEISDDSTFCEFCGKKILLNHFSDFTIRIGRAPDNDLVINDPHVSSYHAIIEIITGSTKIEDQNSKNGTFVNGKKIIISIINWGDKINLGKNYELNWKDIDKALSKKQNKHQNHNNPVVSSKVTFQKNKGKKRELPVVYSKSIEKKNNIIENLPKEEIVKVQRRKYNQHTCPACGSDRITKYSQYKNSKKVTVKGFKGGGGGCGCTPFLLLIIIFILAPGLLLLLGIIGGAATAGLYALREPIMVIIGIIIVISIIVAIYNSNLWICEKCGKKFH